MTLAYPRLALFSVLISISLSAAVAADRNGKYTMLSMGTKSCGNVVSDFKADESGKLNNSIWVAGYLTALNQYVVKRKNIAQGTDPAAWDLWINNFCSANPLESLAGAASALSIELDRKFK